MNKDEQIKALAELDGWMINNSGDKVFTNFDNQKVSIECLDYLTSRDAIVPVIEKQVEKNPSVMYEIQDECTHMGVEWVILATPQQLSEALLRSTGKWKETK